MRKKNKNLIDYIWITKIVLLAFLISIVFTFVSETAIPNINVVLGIILCLIFIVIGVIFDMVGVAVASADEAVFHSMASRKLKGAAMAVKLKKNADKVSSFCNDVIGDICGIISGSTGAVIAIKIAENNLLVTLFIMGIISALTIGGKALEKSLAITKSNNILFIFAKILCVFKRG